MLKHTLVHAYNNCQKCLNYEEKQSDINVSVEV